MQMFLKIIWAVMVCVGTWNVLAPKDLCWLDMGSIPGYLLIFIVLSGLNIFFWIES